MDTRLRAQGDLEALDVVIGELISALQEYRQVCVGTQDVVRGGEPVARAFEAARDVDARASVSGALKAFEQARYRSRLSLIAVSQQDGLPSGTLAELLGISRQLATRWIRESGAVAAGDVADERAEA